MDTTSDSSPFSPLSPASPASSTEAFPNGPGRRAPGTRSPPTPLALDPEVKSAAEAQRTAAMQYPDSLARLMGLLNAKVFENQYQQEELISRLPAGQGQATGDAQGLETANRYRELENAQRGRREFCRMVQLEVQLRSLDRSEKPNAGSSSSRSSSSPRGEISTN